MPFRNHPREITKEQFAAQTAIDGNRLDKAMGDVVDRFNEIPKGDVKSRFIQSQFVMGWQPAVANDNIANYQWPWMHHWNHGTAEAPFDQFTTIANEFRGKGYAAPGIDLDSGSADLRNAYYIFEASWGFSRPAIIESIDVFMLIDEGGGAAGVGFR